MFNYSFSRFTRLRILDLEDFIYFVQHTNTVILWSWNRLAELRRLLYLVLEFDYYPSEGFTFRGITTLFQYLKYLRIHCYTWWTKLIFGSLPWLQHLHIDLARDRSVPDFFFFLIHAQYHSVPDLTTKNLHHLASFLTLGTSTR